MSFLLVDLLGGGFAKMMIGLGGTSAGLNKGRCVGREERRHGRKILHPF